MKNKQQLVGPPGRLAPANSWRRSRIRAAFQRPLGKHSDRVRWTKQGAVVGCVAEPLPAAETGEAEQGQPSKYASGRRPALHIWSTATRSSAPVFASGRRPAPQKSAKRKRAVGRPLPSGLRCPVFAAGVAAPLQKADRGPCSASAVSAAGSASAPQPPLGLAQRPDGPSGPDSATGKSLDFYL